MLVVIEGPDEVGKTTISTRLASALEARALEVETFSFPGRESGTPGDLVYTLHHDPSAIGVEPPTPTALQLFHCAAHADAIEKRIIPALAGGQNVVLDRGWWSLVVYARVGGVRGSVVSAIQSVERQLWAPVPEPFYVLVDAPEPHAPVEDLRAWRKLRSEYHALANEEREAGASIALDVT